jgi:hypothetical protein
MGLAEPVGDSNVMYLYIIEGHLMQKVNEDTPGAVKRNWKAPDGATGSKWELQYKNLTGYITGIEFKQGDFGEQCIIKIEADGEKANLQMSSDSRYFSTFAQRFKNIRLEGHVCFNAYDFEKDGKKRSGMSITQDGKKVESYFWDSIAKAPINGLPQPDNRGSGFDKDDWKMYFIQLKKFLKRHIEFELSNLAGHDPVIEKEETKMAEPVSPEQNKAFIATESTPPPPQEEDDLPF